ncbi:putative FAD-linked oxidoreductase [Methyloligella halotolerans]|uniref:Putative FAD-linked oxidoreductase n=1 Tax=Methyloligella halotolerans TaxID=1177755 RepID=A0A1E2RYX9_9HYPH|nr:FAD-binding oxidoreductase [Methyloligella halotolerans]ODA67308.1 putative FAD-linked oxidoreductase [Methyloligella halotolerans]
MAELKAPSPDILQQFVAIVGEAHAISDAGAMAPYLHEWRDRYHGKAALVLMPGSVDEVSQILALANQTGTAIVPQGGNTGLVGGQIPSEAGDEILLNLSRLNRIREIDLAGNCMTVEAGLVLAQAQDVALNAHRLFPLRIASEGSCQIGGVLSTNAGGTAVLAYGNARDLVLGLEVVLADGRVWDGLKPLRKDNSGYDLKHLFMGAEGTLGVITAAVIRLFPIPAETATAMVGFRSLQDAAAFFDRAYQFGATELTAFEIIPRIGIEFVTRHFEGTKDPLQKSHAWYALVEFSSANADAGLASGVEALLAEALEAGEIADGTIAHSLDQAGALWRLREDMSEAQKYEGGSIKHDVSVPVADIPEFITRADQLIQLMVPGARPVPFGHYGDGNIHYNISQPPGQDKAIFLSHWEAVNAAVHEIVLDLGGSISAEHGVGQAKRDMLPHAKSEVELELMRSIKRTLDPKGILNPGKVV